MPLFRFRVRGRTDTFDDLEGAELPDLQSASHEAVASAREIWADGIRGGINRGDWTIEIIDEQGEVLRSIPFSDTAGPDGPVR